MEHPENDIQYKGLKVNEGVSDVPTINPYLKKRIKRKEYTPSEFVEGILKGNITILSQAVTLVESAKYEHQQTAQDVSTKHQQQKWQFSLLDKTCSTGIKLQFIGHHSQEGKGKQHASHNVAGSQKADTGNTDTNTGNNRRLQHIHYIHFVFFL
jgi:hypothetical protein